MLHTFSNPSLWHPRPLHCHTFWLNKDHQRMMVDPIFIIARILWLFLTAVTPTTAATIAEISPVFTWIYLNLPEFNWIFLYIPVFTWIYLNIPEFTWIYLGLPGFTRIYWNLHVFTKIYMNLPDFTWIYLILPKYT